jgi:hypothetical protein
VLDCNSGVAASRASATDASRACVIEIAQKEADAKVSEKTGRNDGERVFAYLRAGGMKNPEKVDSKSRSWCGGFVSWVLKACGFDLSKIRNPLATADWVAAKGSVRHGVPLPGDLVLFNFSGRKAGADHIEIAYAYNPNPRFPFFTTIGGNTSDPARKAGNGVYMKPSRLKRQISYVYPLQNLQK